MPDSTPPTKTRGRPPVPAHKKRVKITASIPKSLESAAKKLANKKDESFSEFVSRALQTAVLEA